MEIALVAVAAVVTALAIAAPLWRGVTVEEFDERLDELTARKRAALEALVDLDSEHAAGKLSDDDLGTLRPAYEAEAVAVLGELDALGSQRAEDILEAEIAAVRARLERD